MGLLLAIVLTAPVVGVQTDGIAPCDTSAFARDLRALRPELEIALVSAPLAAPAGAWLARLEGIESDQAILRVTGNPTPLLRPLPGQDCARVVQTAASIVDGLLDQLPNPARDVGLPGNSTAERVSLSAWVASGILQGPITWVPSFALGAHFGLGSLEIVGSVDVGLPASIPLVTEDQGLVGNYQAVPVDLELGAGWGPRLGPGRLSLDGSVGAALAIVSASAPGPDTAIAAEFFLSAAAGYAIDLPAHFLLGLRVEERWAPAQATLRADGAPPSDPGDQVVTRAWTFTSTVVVGYRFF